MSIGQYLFEYAYVNSTLCLWKNRSAALLQSDSRASTLCVALAWWRCGMIRYFHKEASYIYICVCVCVCMGMGMYMYMCRWIYVCGKFQLISYFTRFACIVFCYITPYCGTFNYFIFLEICKYLYWNYRHISSIIELVGLYVHTGIGAHLQGE